MVNVTDPVGVGLVASLARPGGNVTGLSQRLTAEIHAKQLQLLKEALPRVSRVACSAAPPRPWALGEYETGCQSLELRVQFAEMRSRNDLGPTVRQWRRSGSTP